MKIVIQCAGTKIPPSLGAGFRSQDNRLVKFVVQPDLCQQSEDFFYAKPDDLSDNVMTWRERLLEYNISKNMTNPMNLTPAFQLYKNKIYRELVKKFGIDHIFILSAGWGLIPANFLTPDYDITFSSAKKVEKCSQRKKNDAYADLCLIPNDDDTVVFIGGKGYLPMFCKLTLGLKFMKKIFYNSNEEPCLLPGFQAERFNASRNMNWHYECAQALIDGKIGR